MFHPIALTALRSVPANGERERVVEVPAGRQREPVDKGTAASESDATIGRRREGEESDDVRTRSGRFKDDSRVAANVVIVLGEDKPVGRDDLKDGVHRRAEVPRRFQARHQRLAAIQR